MAINPENQYPGKIKPSSAEYPYGEARNITTPGDGTGTPWEAALVNDIFGFQQALLSGASIVPSGDPDEVGASQYLDALKRLFTAAVETVADAGALELPENATVLITESGRGGPFVVKSGAAPSDPENGVFIDIANGNHIERVFEGPLFSTWFGASTSNTAADNRTALQAAITLADAQGYGHIINPSPIDFGVENNDVATYPDFTGVTTDMVVEDRGIASANGTDKAGMQTRLFYYTEQTSPTVGQHNGNGERLAGDWAPYYWVDNTESYAAKGDPSRTADDNRRASIFFATRGVANWRVGQGTRSGDFNEAEMADFLIAANGLPDIGVTGLTAMLVFLKTNGYLGVNTNGPNVPIHLATRSAHPPQFRLDGSNSSGTLRLLLDQASLSAEIQVQSDRMTFVVGGATEMEIKDDGTISMKNLSTYADDSAAGVGGLVAGDVYQTAGGELRIKL